MIATRMGYSGTTVRKECNPQIIIFECLIVLCSFDCLLFDLREIRKYGAVNQPRTSWRPPDGTPVSRPVQNWSALRYSLRIGVPGCVHTRTLPDCVLVTHRSREILVLVLSLRHWCAGDSLPCPFWHWYMHLYILLRSPLPPLVPFWGDPDHL